jgi:hypothetical protein
MWRQEDVLLLLTLTWGVAQVLRSCDFPLTNLFWCILLLLRSRPPVVRSCHPSLTRQLHYEYPGLGHTLYFDLAHNTHSVLYEVPCHRLNWLW